MLLLQAFFLTGTAAMARESYYDILQVAKDATADQLKAGYKKQAMKWHPDKNMNQREAAEERFKLIAGGLGLGSDGRCRALVMCSPARWHHHQVVPACAACACMPWGHASNNFSS